MLSEKAMNLVNYLKGIGDQDVTVHDVAEALGTTVNSITGTFNSLVKKELGTRVEAEIKTEEGTHKAVKFLKLTDAGKTYENVEDAE